MPSRYPVLSGLSRLKETFTPQNKETNCTSFAKKLSGFVVIFILTITQISSAEKVGKAYYEGFPNELNGSIVQLPSDIVALSEKINFPNDSTSLFVNSSSIFFVIDHSGSMYNYYYDLNGNGKIQIPRDPNGNRFEVTKAIVDTLANNPKKYPGIECGLAVFTDKLYFDDGKDKLLKQVSGISRGGYLPLLKLDSLYDSDYGLLSPDSIFHKYLDVKDVNDTFKISKLDTTINWKYKDLTIPNEGGSGTNVDLGYKAAISAMKNSRYNRNNQFIVFISDGESNSGNNDYEKGVINNDTIPTTFTVFFTQSGVAPQSLEDMNEAIKNNGYSESNKEYTQLWKYENTNVNNLIKFFMDNVVSIFEGEIKSLPKKLEVKGSSIGSHWDSTSSQFVLDNLIPLTGDTTNINLSIYMDIIYDTVDNKGNSVKLKKDTTINIDNNFWIDTKSNTIQPKFEVLYWDRNISFENSGAVISELDETITNFDIIFTNDPMNSDYKYENCEIEIKAIGSGDVETYTLSKDGTQKFKKTVNIKSATGSVTTENGILEYNIDDTFIATFRNSESVQLPLDTLVKEIGYNSFLHIKILSSDYFDQDANGKIDKIIVKTDCNDMEDFKDTITSIITSSISSISTRNFSVETFKISNSTINFEVIENSSTINTATTKSDKITLSKSTHLSDTVVIDNYNINISDSVAPVIISATVVDSLKRDSKDYLFVKLSEEMDSSSLKNTETPFRFFDKDAGYEFTAYLNKSGPKQAGYEKFLIKEVSGNGKIKIISGDSICINETKKIKDIVNNIQKNHMNIRREIIVNTVAIPVEITLNSTIITPDETNMIIQLKLTGENELPEGAELSSVGNIYDYVGNHLVGPFNLEYDKKTNSSLFKWDGKNRQNRDIGSGSYMLIVNDIIIRYNNGSTVIANKDLGVRRLIINVQR